jgi:outer membrane protein assembly factor BamA
MKLFLKRYSVILMFLIQTLHAQKYSLSFTQNPLKFKYVKIADSAQHIRTFNDFLNFYKARGYAACNVDSVSWLLGEARAFAFIGERYVIKNFHVDNLDPKSNAHININEKYAHSPADTTVFSNYAGSVLSFYENNGYPFSRINVDSVEMNQAKFAVYLSLDKGPLFLFDSVHIDGDAQVKKKFISAYTGMRVGKSYSEATYRKANDKLNQLPFLYSERIPQIVFITGGRAKPYLYLKKKKADQVNGIIGLAPGGSGASGSQSQDLVLTGEFMLKLNNLFKSGKMLMINWKSFQARSQELKTAFNYPYILGKPIGVDVAFNFLKYDTLYTNIERQIGLQYYTSGMDGFKFFYNVKSTNLNTVDTNAVRSSEQFPSTNAVEIKQYGLAASFNLLDYKFNPRRGWMIESTVSAGSKLILRDNLIEQVKFGTIDAPYTLYDSTVLRTNQYVVRLKIDKYFPVGMKIIAPTIYFNEVLREGGINSLKGFNEQSIYATNFNMVEIDYRFLLGANSYIKAFWNGAYYEDHTAGKQAVYDTPWGFGIGANIETRAGILSILYALGKEKQNNFELRAGKIHFGISSYF